METVKLAIVGSRSFDNYATLKRIIEGIRAQFDYEWDSVISGGASGADYLGEKYADEFVIDKVIYKAEWDKYGKRAGFIRNEYIIRDCDVCICFWDGESHGTKHDIELCEKMHKKCFVYNYVRKTLTLFENK